MWLLLACHAHPPSIAPAAPTAAALIDGAPVHGGLVLEGFDVTWDTRPHRIQRVSFGAVGTLTAEGVAGQLTTELRGGSWADGDRGTDEPIARLDYAVLESPDLSYVAGHADLVLTGGLDAGGARRSAHGVVLASVPLDDRLPHDALAVWITGFSVTAGAEHPDGFTVHSLGIGVSAPEYDGHDVTFEVSGGMDAGAVPDRPQDLSDYGTTVRVEYAVIAAKGHAERFSVAEADAGTADDAPHRDLFTAPIGLDVPAGLPVGVVGLSSFDIELIADGPLDGRYVRSVTVALDDVDYDGDRGRFDATARLQFANDGPIPRRTTVRENAEWTLVQLAAGDVRTGTFAPDADDPMHRVYYPSFSEVSVKSASGK
jgi:hypothetical protein